LASAAHLFDMSLLLVLKTEVTSTARSPALAATARSALDDAALDAIRALDPDGKDQLLTRLAQLYLRDSTRLLAQLLAAQSRSAAEEVARAAHSLKSSSANLGACEVAARAAQIELAARRGLLEELAAQIETLKSEHQRALDGLAAVITGKAL
jgi:HPt (histidine-containing phosphotransfer) domain-containing protein